MSENGREEFLANFDVSRETSERLDLLHRMVLRWNPAINLVSRSTINDIWQRHIADSYQLVQHLRDPDQTIIDLGSGGGFPGLVIAAGLPNPIHLVESDRRKSIFLTQCRAELGLGHVEIHNRRVEDVWISADVITARAFASISKILSLSSGLRTKETRYLLLKGKSVLSELTDARCHWHMDIERHGSNSSADGSLVILNHVVPKSCPTDENSGS